MKAFVPKYGSYVCRVIKRPSENDPILTIHWENSCWGEYGGKNLKYMVTFFVLVPEGVYL
ncbi:hypothetical protein NLC27_03560 [Candidatus Aminicenantes bacterium AC-708-I09]|nr:hypothetical protein [Candidatus Aminicenantes bacterium AC-708-I09]